MVQDSPDPFLAISFIKKDVCETFLKFSSGIRGFTDRYNYVTMEVYVLLSDDVA